MGIVRNYIITGYTSKNETMGKRIKKTLNRKIRDLDEHLYFVQEALIRISQGDSSYLKLLSAELRVLVCYSSGTEGLLWRMCEELNVKDYVYAHCPGNLDRKNPLAENVSLLFTEIYRGGFGDPRLPPAFYSLRDIIKDNEAAYISGKGLTYEHLIKSVSQQMGSAHEDDGVDPHIAEFYEVFSSNKRVVCQLIQNIGDFVLEVGFRVLQWAIENMKFYPRERKFEIGSPLPTTPEEYVSDFEEAVHPEIGDQGTISFILHHPHHDWHTNASGYNFGPFIKGPIKVHVKKYINCQLEIKVNGIFPEEIVSVNNMPPLNQPRASVSITWQGGNIVFYINGKPVESMNVQNNV
ncbi:MAG: hypothetical protein KJ550_12925 [Proteobacteria bacterium]|nr:hypothetical protein [Desulfobacteraceae bacterium]MBU3981063.1 hypothetical protein [Pseudomonadota bacterium]MBU4014348.1 hypothetical protein [Pseudomonadota bacterium]MBU4067013.1 hypothetical protein [Pseudomonadota bacterium]MBU4099754.1 hypothetical protein [Pseudomonadota bacterium]